MIGKMKGYALTGKQRMEWVEKPIPIPTEYDVLIKPLVISACTSDVHIYDLFMCPDSILGHEGVGEIVEVGKKVYDFKVGDKVIIPATTPIWRTLECQMGYPQHSGGVLMGCTLGSVRDGLFAEYGLINDADLNLALIPDGMDLLAASMIGDMVTTGLHGNELAEVSYGDSVVIIGIGPVGLMAVAGAKLKGAGRIIAVGSRLKCREIAKFYGATDVVNYKDGDIYTQIMDLTKGKAVDRCIICAPYPEAMIDAVKIVRPGGNVANLNTFSHVDSLKIPMEPNGWAFGLAHKTIRGGLCPGGRVRMEYLSNLVQYGRLDPTKLITHIYHGFEHIEDAFEIMCRKPDDFIKPVVICG